MLDKQIDFFIPTIGMQVIANRDVTTNKGKCLIKKGEIKEICYLNGDSINFCGSISRFGDTLSGEGTYSSSDGSFSPVKVVDDSFVLPEYWQIKITKDNVKQLCCYVLSVMPDYTTTWYPENILKYNYVYNSKSGKIKATSVNPERQEITNEQFQKYVLKQPINKTCSTEDLSKVSSFKWQVGDTVKRIKGAHTGMYEGDTAIITGIPYGGGLSFNYEDIVHTAAKFVLVKRAENIPVKVVDEPFILPEKWYIQPTNETTKILEKWRGGGYSGNIKDVVLLSDKYWAHKPVYKNYEEITFEQFQTYVLNQPLYKQINKIEYENSNSINESKRLNETISRRESSERSDISIGGCGDGLTTSSRKRQTRSAEIGKRLHSEGEGLHPRRRSERIITI